MPNFQITYNKPLPSVPISSHKKVWYPSRKVRRWYTTFYIDMKRGCVKPSDILEEAIGTNQTLSDHGVIEQARKSIEEFWKKLGDVLHLGGLVNRVNGNIYPDYGNTLKLNDQLVKKSQSEVILTARAKFLKGKMDFHSEGPEFEDWETVTVIPKNTDKRLTIFSWLLPSDDNVTHYIDWGFRLTISNDQGQRVGDIDKVFEPGAFAVYRENNLPELISIETLPMAFLMDIALNKGRGYIGEIRDN